MAGESDANTLPMALSAASGSAATSTLSPVARSFASLSMSALLAACARRGSFSFSIASSASLRAALLALSSITTASNASPAPGTRSFATAIAAASNTLPCVPINNSAATGLSASTATSAERPGSGRH